MHRIDIGVDPDSKAHGTAIAIDKRLVQLECLTLMELHDYLLANREHEIHLHIEDVLASNAIFKKKGTKGEKPEKEVARSVGMMQQSLSELLRMIDHIGLPNVTIHKYKISSQWKPSKGGSEMLARCWGWKKRSNEEKRSAAYFLTLGCR